MPRIVVSTAILKCDRGDANAPLLSLGLGQFEALFKPAASVEDHTPGTNIFPFGRCDVLGGPCVPTTPEPWSPAASLSLAGASALRADAKLRCTHCGVITVVDPGQHAVDVDAAMAEFLRNFSRLLASASDSELRSLLENMALAGVISVPDAALDRVLGQIKATLNKPDLSKQALDDLDKALKAVKALKGANVALGSVLDLVELADAISSGDYKKAASKAVGIGAGLLVTTQCATAVAPAAAAGPAGAIAVGEGCGVAGVAAGLGVEKLIGGILP